MKSKVGLSLSFIGVGILIVAASLIHAPMPVQAQESAAQISLAQKFISNGVGAQGVGVLQDGQLSTLSASIASATRARLATAPASGSIYLRGILVEEAATAASGSTVTLSYGTGTNCGTNNTVLLGPITAPPAGLIPLGILVPSGKDLCAATDAATTVARVLTD